MLYRYRFKLLMLLTLAALSPLSSQSIRNSAERALASVGHGLFDDGYVASCPSAEINVAEKCSGLYGVHSPDDTQIALLINGEASLRARLQILRNARKTISIQALVFRGDESGLYVANVLRAKQAQGVKVRVLMDAASNPEPTTWWMYTDLMAHPGFAPIWVKGYGEVIEDLANNRTAALNQRFHDKLWIVDGEEDYGVAVMGGMNIANEYFRADPKTPSLLWRDQDIIVRGGVVKDLNHAFEANNDYFLQTQKQPMFNKLENLLIDAVKNGAPIGETVSKIVFHPQYAITDQISSFGVTLTDPVTGVEQSTGMDLPFPVSAHVMGHIEDLFNSPLPLEQMFRPATVRFLHNRPRLNETYIRDAYIERLDSARTEVLIANAYFLPNPEVTAAIKRAARRGVEVNIITNSAETNDLKELSYASRYNYKDLMDAGVHMWEWRGDKHGQGTIHAKFAVFDRTSAIVGSYNLDPRSEQLNSETVLAFQNDELAEQLATQYTQSDLANSELIDAATAEAYHENKKWGAIQVQTFLSLKFKGML